MQDKDYVNMPEHYRKHPSGIEAISICRHMNFNLGNAIKYLLRCEHKGNKRLDLQKARKYIDFELENMDLQELSDMQRSCFQAAGEHDYTGLANG